MHLTALYNNKIWYNFKTQTYSTAAYPLGCTSTTPAPVRWRLRNLQKSSQGLTGKWIHSCSIASWTHWSSTASSILNWKRCQWCSLQLMSVKLWGRGLNQSSSLSWGVRGRHEWGEWTNTREICSNFQAEDNYAAHFIGDYFGDNLVFHRWLSKKHAVLSWIAKWLAFTN